MPSRDVVPCHPVHPFTALRLPSGAWIASVLTFLGCEMFGAQTNSASSVMSALRSLETGQFCSASLAIRAKVD